MDATPEHPSWLQPLTEDEATALERLVEGVVVSDDEGLADDVAWPSGTNPPRQSDG